MSPRSDIKPRRLAVAIAIVAVAALASWWWIADPTISAAVVITTAYIVLCLSEAVPPFVPTLVLLVLTPLLLGPVDPRFELSAVLRWPAEPMLALFAGGMALGIAAQRRSVDTAIVAVILRIAGTGPRRLVAFLMLGTAVLSMWMSNIAAAALMIAAIGPLATDLPTSGSLRRGLLLGVAVGANLGGIATPIGTGANAIAIAAVEGRQTISFLHWMAFAVPLVAAMLVVAFLMITLGGRVTGVPARVAAAPRLGRAGQAVVVLFFLAVAAWLTEPLHGVPAPVVALAVTAILFGSGLLAAEDLRALDWSTLGLIAGGLSLGRLIEEAGMLHGVADIAWTEHPRIVWLGGLALASALMSALMSNTATVALLVPLGLAIDPSPSTAVVIAIAASFGMPFVISTPPNAMVYGTGHVSSRDLLWIGVPLMLLGCALVTLTGPLVLRLFGVT